MEKFKNILFNYYDFKDNDKYKNGHIIKHTENEIDLYVYRCDEVKRQNIVLIERIIFNKCCTNNIELIKLLCIKNITIIFNTFYSYIVFYYIYRKLGRRDKLFLVQDFKIFCNHIYKKKL